MLMWSLFNAADMKVPEVRGIAVACVVPPMLGVVEDLCKSYFHVEPIVVGPGVKRMSGMARGSAGHFLGLP